MFSPSISAGLLLAAALYTSGTSAQTSSSKRGLVYVPVGPGHDDDNWDRPGSSITWYYNYKFEPSPAYADKTQEQFEFVPMLWGPTSGTEFYDSVTAQIKAGRNITRVLGFNEPDGPAQYGGSNMLPSLAAQVWVKNIEPLAQLGIKLGLPGTTGGWGGVPWLNQFLGNCSQILSANLPEKRNCTYDFVNIHWYGNFDGLASHLGTYAAAFPNVTQWVTEYALDNSDLRSTQQFFNTSMEYFDRLESVGRYSYFGSFRSQYSNVGPNVVMLNNDGKLTDIGSWYLGGSATGVDPQSGTKVNSAKRLEGSSLYTAMAAGFAAWASVYGYCG
ncbi:glycosyl hydrolase [Microdochium nivale]|nr:glycosyl hydrolase [Microdochium nivale]